MMDPRGSDNKREANQRGLRHRIPYRLLGRRSMGTKRLVVSSKVWLSAIPTQNCDVVLTFPANTNDNTLMWLLARLKARAPSLTVHVRHHSHTGIYGFYITAMYESLLQGAEEVGLLKTLKSEYGGGMKEFVFEDQDCFAGVEEEATFLTSQERQSIVLHFLHELRATGDDCLEGIKFVESQPIVPLLITKKVISQVFPLHNNEDLKHLRQSWVQAIFSPQPLDLVRQYFGVKIGLYFAYLGHYTTWLILPALVGIFVFLVQGYDQWIEDLCFLSFSLFITLWSSLYLKFWNRSSTEYSYKWGTLDKKDELLKDPRPLFQGDLMKSPVTSHLELAYPSWKRILFRYLITFPIIALSLSVVFISMLLCFELQEFVNELIMAEDLPYIFSFGPKVLLAVLVSILDEVYKTVAVWLTHKGKDLVMRAHFAFNSPENYRLDEAHETSLVLKLVMFQFVNSFLSLFYIGFYLGDLDRLRDQLAALLITRQVLGNLKEALLPYVIWKARLYSVGYSMATRMSPDSLEKEVRKMTTRCRRRTSVKKKKDVSSNTEAKKSIDSSPKNSDGDSSNVTEEEEEGIPTLTQAEVESAMKKYEDTLDDYLEMSIQFGYITLFSSAFPLAALCALLNNIIEIRSDAFKLCLTHQRPFGKRVDNIGIWKDVLIGMSFLAVLVNCALMGTTGVLTRMLPGLNTTAYVVIVVVIEHVVVILKTALDCAVPDVPQAMATEMAKLEHQRREVLKHLESQMSPFQSGPQSLAPLAGSPHMRRRKPSDICSAPDLADTEISPARQEDSNSSVSSPRIITPSSLLCTSDPSLTQPNPNSGVCSPLIKPAVPPRKSVQQTEAMSKLKRMSHAEIAEKVVAAAMNPILDSMDLKSTAPLSSALPGANRDLESSFPTGGETFRRVFKRQKDFDTRRRSEPVTSAVSMALSLQKSLEPFPVGLPKKGVFENREDLRDLRMEDVKRSRESLVLRDEIRKSKERLSLADTAAAEEVKEKQPVSTTDGYPSPLSSSSSIPRLSVPSSNTFTLPPCSSSYRLAASPRFPRGSGLGDSSSLASRILSRKSRSFSSTDVSEARQALREKYSPRNDASSVSLPQKPHHTEPNSVTEMHPRCTVKDPTDVVTGQTDKSKDSCVVKAGSEKTSSSSSLESEGHRKKEGKEPVCADCKTPLTNRAMRESRSKPLSITTKSSTSGK